MQREPSLEHYQGLPGGLVVILLPDREPRVYLYLFIGVTEINKRGNFILQISAFLFQYFHLNTQSHQLGCIFGSRGLVCQWETFRIDIYRYIYVDL